MLGDELAILAIASWVLGAGVVVALTTLVVRHLKRRPPRRDDDSRRPFDSNGRG